MRADSFRDRFDLVLLRSVSRAAARSRRVENCPLGILVGSTIEEEVAIEDGKEHKDIDVVDQVDEEHVGVIGCEDGRDPCPVIEPTGANATFERRTYEGLMIGRMDRREGVKDVRENEERGVGGAEKEVEFEK